MAYVLTLAGALGLLIGSFLNVVIHRLPKIMEREWQQQHDEYQAGRDHKQTDAKAQQPEPQRPREAQLPYNLIIPRSHCPHCRRPIAVMENIPVLSFILQAGRCRGCAAQISWRYPLVEILTGAFFCLVVWRFGPGVAALGGLVLVCSLVALTFIDLETTLLPDIMTLPLLWLGLLFNVWGFHAPLADAVIGAVSGYLLLWSIYWIFKLLTGKEGMGYGDFKLLAALGAWLGWMALPGILFFASLTGAVVGGVMAWRARSGRYTPIPFGPYLSAAGLVSLFFGNLLL